MKRRTVIQLAAAAACSLLMLGAVFAQDYPNRPIRLIVPWPAGGMRGFGLAHARAAPGRPAGAAGGGRESARRQRPDRRRPRGEMAPDGYTLFVASAEPLAVDPHVYRSLPYDPARDFVGITPFVINPSSLVSRFPISRRTR